MNAICLRSLKCWVTLLLVLLLGFVSFDLNAVYITRFNATDNGALAITGNTLGLSKLVNSNNAGFQTAIGAFSTVDTSVRVGNFPFGTTLTWQNNSAMAVLDMPPGSTVLYAELVWGGSYGFQGEITGNEPNTPINITTPLNVTSIVAPDPATAQSVVSLSDPTAGFYVRSQDVTAIVQAGGAGNYTVGGIAATVAALNNNDNTAGWTLIVAYHNGNIDTQNLTILVGCEASTSPSTFAVTGFSTPSAGPLSGRMFLSALEGDCNVLGDQFLFGSNPVLTTPADALSSPGNPINNFFASQINSLLPFSTNPVTGKYEFLTPGQLDTRGTFGTRNPDVATSSNVSAGRQGYDITSIDVSDRLVNNQTMAYIMSITATDAYVVNAFGLQVGVAAPTITGTTLVDGQTSVSARVGSVLTITSTFTNTGLVDATGLVYQDVLPAGLSYVPNSTFINGVLVTPDPDPTAGINIGNLSVGDSVVVQFSVQVIFANDAGVFTTQAQLGYTFIDSNDDPMTLTATTNAVTIFLNTFTGTVKTCKFFNGNRYSVTAAWSAPVSLVPVAAYQFFSKGKLIAVIPATLPNTFSACFRSKKAVNTLQMRVVFQDNTFSNFTNIVVTYE